jgi:hypothetical protein
MRTGRTPAALERAREASMYSGLILAAFIGLGVAWLFTRIRRRMGMPVNGKHWTAAVLVFVVLMVLAYGASHTPH